MGKKKLDKLFQEKFENFSEVPEDKVWQSIEASLDQKKKSRKAIPIWWALGGAAAVLAIAIFAINPFENKINETPIISDVETPAEKTSKEKLQIEPEKSAVENVISNDSQIVVTEEKESAVKESKVAKKQATSIANNKFKNSNTAVSKKQSKESILNTKSISSTEVVSNEVLKPKEASTVVINQNVAEQVDLISKETEVVAAVNTIETKDSSTNSTDQEEPFNELDKELNNASKQELVRSSDAGKENEKKSIFDEIAAQKEEKEVLAEKSGSKWSAGPSVAPVYFNAIGEGSPVHSIFTENSKSGAVSMSYGLSVAYEVSKKLSIRSGVHKVDFGYNTNDVEFSSSVESSVNSRIDNVDYALTAKNLVVRSSRSNTPVEAEGQNALLDSPVVASEVSAASASRNGIMEQQFGYIEVPVELNYSLIDNRFGINLIGGVSSLFLIDNSVSLSSGDLTTEMGEANNVNNVNFSTNVGFGVNYKFTPKLRLNIEPVFKYQMNTFSRTDGSFQPFSVGVYSGLSFRF